jgi:hypothetical protein
MVQALFTARVKFVHPGRIERMALLRQPHDGTKFDVFTAGEMMSLHMPFQREEQMQIAGHKIQTVRARVQCFPIKILQHSPSLLCHLPSHIVMAYNHTIDKNPMTLAVPTKVHKFLEFDVRLVFQVGHHFELLQLCFYTYA